MARWIALVAALALVGFVVLKWGGYLDGPDRAKQLKIVMEEHSKLLEEAMSAFRQAKSQSDQKAAQEKLPNPPVTSKKPWKSPRLTPAIRPPSMPSDLFSTSPPATTTER